MALEERMAKIEGAFEQVSERLGRMETDLRRLAEDRAHLDGRITALEMRVARVEGSLGQVTARLDRIETDLRDLRHGLNAKADKGEIRIWFLLLIALVTLLRFLG